MHSVFAKYIIRLIYLPSFCAFVFISRYFLFIFSPSHILSKAKHFYFYLLFCQSKKKKKNHWSQKKANTAYLSAPPFGILRLFVQTKRLWGSLHRRTDKVLNSFYWNQVNLFEPDANCRLSYAITFGVACLRFREGDSLK